VIVPTAATVGPQQLSPAVAGLAAALSAPADTEPGGRPLGRPG